MQDKFYSSVLSSLVTLSEVFVDAFAGHVRCDSAAYLKGFVWLSFGAITSLIPKANDRQAQAAVRVYPIFVIQYLYI